MAGPLAGISAAQIAQKPPTPPAEVNKQGPSKFDQSMKSGQSPDKTHQPQHAQQANQIQQAEKIKQVENAGKVDKASLGKVDRNLTSKAMEPVAQKSEVGKTGSMISSMMSNMEKGQASLDKLINGSLNGKQFSNSEMIGLQAGMYKYSQELDLTSKVIEKATGGLKDALKTQV